MAQNIANEEKVFEHFLKLPKHLRMIVNNKMRPDDRCRFTRCSKLCNEETKASKNYIYQLDVACWLNDYIRITILHGNHELGGIDRQGFRISFFEASGKKFKNYYSLAHDVTLWDIELNQSTNLVQSAIDEVRKRMKIYQNSVKKLKFDSVTLRGNKNLFKDVNFGIESLNNLEQLDVLGDIDVLQFLTKLRKPLNKLHIDGELNSELLDCKQIYQVRHLICRKMEFKMEQILRLSSKVVDMSIGDLTEKDIFYFIRSWQNGKIKEDLEVYRWNSLTSTFSMRKLSRLLRIKDDDNQLIEIKHFNKAGKSAVLSFNGFSLQFNAGLVAWL